MLIRLPCGQRCALPTGAHHHRNHDPICRTFWTQLPLKRHCYSDAQLRRRACGGDWPPPMTYRYRSRRPDDRELRQRLRELAAQRRRFAYRRLLILLRATTNTASVMIEGKKGAGSAVSKDVDSPQAA